MNLSLFLGLSFLISELLLGLMRRARQDGNSVPRDRNSLRILWVTIFLGIWLGLRLTIHSPASALPHRHTFALLGLATFGAGLILRWWSIVQLGRFFTVNVSIAPDHQLIESGPYRYVRHPSYTGALLAFVGFGLSLGNWAALLAIFLPISAAFIYRMKVEESALADALGARYLNYMGRTKRLVPFVY